MAINPHYGIFGGAAAANPGAGSNGSLLGAGDSGSLSGDGNSGLLPGAPQGMDVFTSMGVLDSIGEDKDVKAVESRLKELRLQEHDIDSGLSMSRNERSSLYGSKYDDYRKKIVEVQKVVVMGLVTATLAAGSIALMAATSAALSPPITGLISITTLVMAFSSKVGTARIYAEALKRWILPKKIDKKIVHDLKSEKNQVEASIKTTEQDLEKAKKTAMKKLAAEKAANRSDTLDDGEDFINIGAMRLRKKVERGPEISDQVQNPAKFSRRP